MGFWISTDVYNHVGYDDIEAWGLLAHAVQSLGYLIYSRDLGSNNVATQNTNPYLGYSEFYDVTGRSGGVGVGQDGTAIAVFCSTDPVVEYVVTHEVNRAGDSGLGGGSGMQVSITNRAIVQYSEFYNTYANQTSRSPIDGDGLDFETGTNNSIAQYNYIHDNAGAGLLTLSSLGFNNINNVFRFNVIARNASKNQAEIYNGEGSGLYVTGTYYNNTVYAGSGNGNGDCYQNPNGGNSVDVLYNNILSSAPGYKSINGTVATGGLEGNDYYAQGGGTVSIKPNGTTYTSIAALRAAGYESQGGSNGVLGDPLLLSPTSNTGGTLPGAPVSTITSFDIPTNSPAKGAGIDLTASPYSFTLVQDFHGVSKSLWSGYSIGAYEYSSPSKISMPLSIH